ncbi:SMI1/KNR4 family protein [Thauera butanivorans]|uniref:SMI1/KNR4 family protein n=1 Tax=Thauera butanivorans TaxID=86174 RepID=UPI000A00DDF8|nr:SMI1/KNR4 family protein [Thauera butanivorans]
MAQWAIRGIPWNRSFFGLPFLSIDKVIQHWNFECSVLDEASPEELEKWSQDYTCLPVGTIKQVVMNKSWIPLADDAAGSYLGLDFDPGVHGDVAQVISFGGREFTRVRAAENLVKFLGNLLFMYEQGQYELIQEDDDEFSIASVSPSTNHFLDYLRMKAQTKNNHS